MIAFSSAFRFAKQRSSCTNYSNESGFACTHPGLLVALLGFRNDKIHFLFGEPNKSIHNRDHLRGRGYYSRLSGVGERAIHSVCSSDGKRDVSALAM